jgi:ubiquinone/menaquinone biosynthesis C-methylase UbiE
VRALKSSVQSFYDDAGWRWNEEAAAFADGAAFDDLRPVTAAYRRRANERVRESLPKAGDLILDAASGAIQYDDYVRFSEGYQRRVCVDLSRRGLEAARCRIGVHGLFVRADVTALPFAPGTFDAVVSLHTLYHVPAEEQATFLREIARVLRAGQRAVVVSVWQTSPWDLALRVPGALVRRARRGLRVLGRFGRAAAPAPTETRLTPVDPPPTASLYFHPTRRPWLRGAVPAGISVRVRCWRSASVDLLRGLGDSPWTQHLLAALTRVEEAWPGWLGRWGAYPLLVLEKPRGYSK